MNRSDLLTLDLSGTRRTWSERPVEFRTTSDGKNLTFDGYASVVERAYPVFGGPPYGWNETIAPGAFKRTLLANADVSFLVNHEGLTLARTKSGTLKLSEDPTGLRAVADLDPKSNAVNDLRSAIERGDVDEMSFGFRVTKDEWTDDEGRAATSQDGTERRITEINLNKGDVSAVNYGANPNTTGGFRGLDIALAELRAGHALDPDQTLLVRTITRSLNGEARETSLVTPDWSGQLDSIEAACGQMRAYLVAMANGVGPDGTTSSPNTVPASSPKNIPMSTNSADLGENRAKYDADQLKAMAKSGEAMPDGSYPIGDAEDLSNAIHAVGRGNASHDTIRKHIIARAKSLGLSDNIPDDWNSDGSMKTANAVTLGPSTEALAALSRLHEQRRVITAA